MNRRAGHLNLRRTMTDARQWGSRSEGDLRAVGWLIRPDRHYRLMIRYIIRGSIRDFGSSCDRNRERII